MLDLPDVQALRSGRLRQMQHEDGEAMQPQGADEDVQRGTWLKQIALASLTAADRLSGIQQVCRISKTLFSQAGHEASLSTS